MEGGDLALRHRRQPVDVRGRSGILCPPIRWLVRLRGQPGLHCLDRAAGLDDPRRKALSQLFQTCPGPVGAGHSRKCRKRRHELARRPGGMTPEILPGVHKSITTSSEAAPHAYLSEEPGFGTPGAYFTVPRSVLAPGR